MTAHWYEAACGALLLVVTTSCGGDDDDSGGGTGGAGTGRDAGTGGAVTVIVPDPGEATNELAAGDTDHDQIQGCWSKPACPAGDAQMTDDYYTSVAQPKTMCLMTGLSARTPGLYLYDTASNSSRGMDSTEHAFLVFADGTVVHTSMRTTGGGQFERNGTAGVTYTDAERCDLADPSYFDDCKTAVEASATPAFEDQGWACAFVDPTTVWITHCEPVEPACD